MSLVELELFRSYVESQRADYENETVLTNARDTAERQVMDYCGFPWRNFTPATTASPRVFVPTGGCVLRIADCTEVTAITISGQPVTDYQLEPVNAVADGVPFEQVRCWSGWTVSRAGEATVTVTAKWGWPSVLATVTAAVLLAGKDELANRKFDFGVLVATDVGAVRALSNPQVTGKLNRLRRAEAYGIG